MTTTTTTGDADAAPLEEQVAALTAQIAALTRSIKDEAEAATTSRRWRIFSVAGLLIVTLALGLSNRAALGQMEADRDEARVAACIGFNEQQARSRAGERAQVRAVLISGELSAARAEQVTAALERHDAQTDKSYPDRDCSDDGITTYYEDRRTQQ